MKMRGKILTRGFILLEVMLSVLIIASGVLLVLRSYSTSLKVSQVARGLSRSCFFLEDKLFDADVKGFTEGFKEEDAGGVFDEDSSYSWRLSILQNQDWDTLCSADIKVFWKKQVVGALTFLRYKEG